MLDYHGPICPDLLMRRLREEGPWEATAPDSTIPVPRSPVPANPPTIPLSVSGLGDYNTTDYHACSTETR